MRTALGIVAALVGMGFTPARTASGVDAELAVASADLSIREAVSPVATPADLVGLQVAPNGVFVDTRTGAVGSLVLSHPLAPGSGVGNDLGWSDLGLAVAPADAGALAEAYAGAFDTFAAAWGAVLGAPAVELEPSRAVVSDGGAHVSVVAARRRGGVPVRGGSLHGVIRHGNLVLVGTRFAGETPTLGAGVALVDAAGAMAAVAAHVAPLGIGGSWREARLEWIPLAVGENPNAAGAGVGLRLAWTLGVTVGGVEGRWEAFVDAASGELFAFVDRNESFDRGVQGGVFPISNDGACGFGPCDGTGTDDGNEQSYPMPFVDVMLEGGGTVTANSAGRIDFAGGIGTDLTGAHAAIQDDCGPIAEATTCRSLDLGASGASDCAVPAGAGSAGNTASSRTVFYHLSRLSEMGGGWMAAEHPARAWTDQPIEANVNLATAVCNANFAGDHLNFFRAGELAPAAWTCRNTGEIAGVIAHEWGHGLDAFDGADPSGSTSLPSGAYADSAVLLGLGTSCIGRGFYVANGQLPGGAPLCSGGGDPCTECSGIREGDWKKRQSGRPHTLRWLNGTETEVPGGCGGFNPAQAGIGAPCGGADHCEGTVPLEAMTDLMWRDLPCSGSAWVDGEAAGGELAGGQCAGGAPTLGEGAAKALLTDLFLTANTSIRRWYLCPLEPAGGWNGGCNADGAYLSLLAADDDNGNLADGTPHGGAIYDAWHRHLLACEALGRPASTATCSPPAAASGLTATPTAGGVELSWNIGPGADSYWVLRTEGVVGCDGAANRIATVTGTSYSDLGLQPGLDYSYRVVPVGGAGAGPVDTCLGAASACTSARPGETGAGGLGAVLTAAIDDATLMIAGDGDAFADNCESVTFDVVVHNIGDAPLSDVRLIGASSPSHPLTRVHSALPLAAAPTLGGSCNGSDDEGRVGLEIEPRGAQHGDTIVLDLELDAIGLVAPVTLTVEIAGAETDLALEPQARFSFEDGLDGWSVVSGTFAAQTAGGGADGSASYLASSTLTSSACDRIWSPELVLTASSTLSIANQFVIEAGSDLTGFYDRANVSRVDGSGDRTVITPDGGRPYTASPNGFDPGHCAGDTAGWVGQGPGWERSEWSAEALGGDGSATRIEVTYATDGLHEEVGFWFDEVVVTDVILPGPDGASDLCPVDGIAVADRFEIDPAAGPVELDVLANDTPAGQARIASVTQPHKVGSTAIVTGADGRDRVLFTPASANEHRMEKFFYTLPGGSTARVKVKHRP